MAYPHVEGSGDSLVDIRHRPSDYLKAQETFARVLSY